MFKKLLAAALPVLAFAAVASVASDAGAEDRRNFTVFNLLPKGWSIDELFVSPNDKDSWGRDILGRDVLHSGDSTHINFHGAFGGECLFDIKVVLVNHHAYRIEDINLCKVSKVGFLEENGALKFVEK